MAERWWPVPQLEAQVPAGQVVLRAPARSDGLGWVAARLRSGDDVRRWEAGREGDQPAHWLVRQTRGAWRQQRRMSVAEARAGRAATWTVLLDGDFAGQVVLVAGAPAARSVSIGYWLDSAMTGRRVGTAAVALALLHATSETGMVRHRVTAEVHPANHVSRRLLRRLGFVDEGLARKALWVDGAWTDHLLVGVCAEDVPRDLLTRVLAV